MSCISSSDESSLAIVREQIIQSFVATVVETVLYACYGCLVVIAGKALLHSARRITLALFSVVATMFMLDTILWIFDIHDMILVVATVLSPSDNSLQDQYQRATDRSLFPLAPIFYTFMTVLGDVIMIWRVFAFWSDTRLRERWLFLIPISLLGASIVTLFMIINCSVKSKGQILLGDFDSGTFCQRVQNASYFATAFTTLSSTLLIGWKTWQYRRVIRLSLRESPSPTRVEKILIILIESGAIYFLFYLKIFIGSLGDLTQKESATTSMAFASIIFTYTTSHIVGIYPAIIVILVHYQKSYIDAAVTTRMESIQFANTIPGTVGIGTAIVASSGSSTQNTDEFEPRRPSHGLWYSIQDLANVSTSQHDRDSRTKEGAGDNLSLSA